MTRAGPSAAILWAWDWNPEAARATDGPSVAAPRACFAGPPPRRTRVACGAGSVLFPGGTTSLPGQYQPPCGWCTCANTALGPELRRDEILRAGAQSSSE